MKERFSDLPTSEKIARISKYGNIGCVFVGLLIGGAFGAAFAFGNGLSALLSDTAENKLRQRRLRRK